MTLPLVPATSRARSLRDTFDTLALTIRAPSLPRQGEEGVGAGGVDARGGAGGAFFLPGYLVFEG